MRKLTALTIILAILVLSGCQSEQLDQEWQPDPTGKESVSQTDPTTPSNDVVFREEGPEFSTSEPVYQTDPQEESKVPPSEPRKPEGTTPHQTEPRKDPPAGNNDAGQATDPLGTNPPPATESAKPTETQPPVTQPPAETQPPATEPPETTEAPTTQPTEPAVTEITYEFKRQVAAYAAQYINQYRSSPCTVLPGMSQVAQYRASQLTYNYGHSTADKRAALANYEYGRFVDATEFGDDASNSYWEADSAEAICAGFYGTDPQAMGKRIADLIRNSSGHWSYISSSEYSYIGIGVEYREGSEYGWYCCVMVGSVDYG